MTVQQQAQWLGQIKALLQVDQLAARDDAFAAWHRTSDFWSQLADYHMGSEAAARVTNRASYLVEVRDRVFLPMLRFLVDFLDRAHRREQWSAEIDSRYRNRLKSVVAATAATSTQPLTLYTLRIGDWIWSLDVPLSSRKNWRLFIPNQRKNQMLVLAEPDAVMLGRFRPIFLHYPLTPMPAAVPADHVTEAKLLWRMLTEENLGAMLELRRDPDMAAAAPWADLYGDYRRVEYMTMDGFHYEALQTLDWGAATGFHVQETYQTWHEPV